MIHLKLEEFLKENGKSLYWLTVQTGRSYQSLKNLTKKDLYGIHFDTLEMLCIAFDCTPGELLEMIKDERKSDKNEQTSKAI